MPLSVIEDEHLLVEGGGDCLTVVDTNLKVNRGPDLEMEKAQVKLELEVIAK